MNPHPRKQGNDRLRPFTEHGRSYEILDLAAKPLGRYLTLQQVLDAIREWPRRTVFLVRLWTGSGGDLTVERQWLMTLGLDGRYQSSPVKKHWTMSYEPE